MNHRANVIGCNSINFSRDGIQVDRSIGCYKEGLKIQIEALGDTDLRVGETCRWQGPGGWHWCGSQE
ncbi:hypothetical protein LWI28_024159 [Acer negundo]|uniref:Uncharacterized protein n=1 Tax=Acer negundo TaxID=4023 RepID=A0AAD5IAQ2_ACENE|nr:hypothetical protein LWI28_024159 [Acer negundo]